MTTLTTLVGAMKATIVTPVVVAMAWSGLADRDGEAQTEQEEESEADHDVAVRTGLSILARPGLD